MRIAYFDCFSGASGDMILGAILDAGLPLEQMKVELAKLRIPEHDLRVVKVLKNGIGGSQVVISVQEDQHHHRNLHHITEIIEASDLADDVKQKSLEVFTRLAEAEARVHGTSIDEIHFHEVGAMDAIIDVVGSVAGLNLLGIEEVFCSPINVGTGRVECAHGILPVPAPATAELMRGKPMYSTGIEAELLTPTGAAILVTFSCGFVPIPPMKIEMIGYGAGSRDLSQPNLLRIFIGTMHEDDLEEAKASKQNSDDLNPKQASEQ